MILREQRPRVTEVEWLQFACCRWGVGSARWLPPGAWAACRQVYEVEPDEPLVLGVDVGGSRSATAVVGCVARDDGRVDVALVEVWQGADAVLKATAYIEALIAAGRPIRELVIDPMRFSSEALRLERDHGLTVIEWHNPLAGGPGRPPRPVLILGQTKGLCNLASVEDTIIVVGAAVLAAFWMWVERQ